MNTNHFIQVDKITKSFNNSDGELKVFKNFSINFDNKKIISIIGPSGCGKTTLLKLITGMESSSTGSILIDGESILQFKDQNQIGYVFQKAHFFPWKTTYKNMLFPIELSGKRVQRSDFKKVEDLLVQFQLTDAKNSYPNQLSGGMLQRANVARALVQKPKLLLLDEPFNSIDEFTREKLWEEFRKIWKEEQILVIIISHNIREAIFLGDTIYALNKKPITEAKKIEVKLPNNRTRETLSTNEFFNAIQYVRSRIDF